MKPLQDVLPPEKRDALRAEVMAKSRWYSPWLHLAVTSFSALGIIAIAVANLEHPRWWHLGVGVALFVLSNAVEWRVHRDFLHKRQKIATVLYDRHTPEHHMIFVTDDMSVRSTQEWRLVLLPAFAIGLIFLGLTPVIAMIWYGWPHPLFAAVDQHNLACVFAIETMGYVVIYEWLHLSYHLPPESLVGRLGFIRWLKRTHAVHHDPRLMQKSNFNVSLPLWDRVRGTYVTTREQVLDR
jgi:sterol desaturase/sphingolipid hydroxylase (fatty acid hydroxylase superfamily)